jgi:hypothetical protein
MLVSTTSAPPGAPPTASCSTDAVQRSILSLFVPSGCASAARFLLLRQRRAEVVSVDEEAGIATIRFVDDATRSWTCLETVRFTRGAPDSGAACLFLLCGGACREVFVKLHHPGEGAVRCKLDDPPEWAVSSVKGLA